MTLEVVSGRGDAEVARIAELQRGVIHRTQLLEAGITPSGIRHRLSRRRLHELYPRAYLVGRPHLEPLALATAAVLHLDGRGVLSHRTAGLVWRLIEADEQTIEATVLHGNSHNRRNLHVHASATISTADIRLSKGLPVTSPARTLLDLAGVLDVHELEAAYAIARRAGLTTPREISAVIRRAPHSKGISNLRDLLHADVDAASQGTREPTLTRSKYERKLLKLIQDARLPRPLANAKVEGMEVDLYWPNEKLIVEFDSFAFHADRAAFERDRERDQQLIAAGYRVIRVTARQLDNSPLAIIITIATALAR